MKKLSFLALFFVVMLAACTADEFEKNTYKTLVVAGTTYDTTMKMVGEAYKNGTITEEQKDMVVGFAEIYYASYMVSVETFKQYLFVKSSGADASDIKTKVIQGLVVTSTALTEFVNAYNSLASERNLKKVE